MVVALVSSAAEVAALERLLARAGWHTRVRDIDKELSSGTIATDCPAEMAAQAGRASRVALLLSVGSLKSALALDRLIAWYATQDVRVMLVIPGARPSSTRKLLARGITAGADDFIVASSVQDELLLRLEALAYRRKATREQRTHPICGIVLDRASRRLYYRDGHVTLTPCEFKIFSCLAKHAGETVSRSTIHQYLGRYSRSRKANLVDVYILYLRRKLARLHCSCAIRTERGAGYALVATGTSAETGRPRTERPEDHDADSLAS
jgi:DNA-binding response OmpR family regulator